MRIQSGQFSIPPKAAQSRRTRLPRLVELDAEVTVELAAELLDELKILVAKRLVL